MKKWSEKAFDSQWKLPRTCAVAGSTTGRLCSYVVESFKCLVCPLSALLRNHTTVMSQCRVLQPKFQSRKQVFVLELCSSILTARNCKQNWREARCMFNYRFIGKTFADAKLLLADNAAVRKIVHYAAYLNRFQRNISWPFDKPL